MQTFDQCEERYDRQFITADVQDAGSEASRAGDRAHKAFEDYGLKGTPLPREYVVFQPILDKVLAQPGQKFFEIKFAVTADKEPCDWKDPTAWQRGKADLLIVNEKRGKALDWKTGKPKDDTGQLKMMAAFAFEHFPLLETVDAAYIWLYHKVPPQTLTYTRDMLPSLWRPFEEKVRRIEEAVSSGVFKPKPSGLCPWCPAYNTCSYARRR